VVTQIITNYFCIYLKEKKKILSCSSLAHGRSSTKCFDLLLT
jgi:hypothetical protein